MEFYREAYDYLKVSGYKVSKNYIRERLEAHPDYPALNSLTDLLDEFHIDNQVVKIEDENHIIDLPKTFFIHTISRDGTTGFKIVEKNNKNRLDEDVMSVWTGIILLMEQGSNIEHDEHQKVYESEKAQRVTQIVVLTLISLFLVPFQLLNFDWVVFIAFLLSTAGLLFSMLLISKEMGEKNTLAEFFCKTDDSGCAKVLSSKFGKWGNYLSLGDLVFIYFAGIILSLSFLYEANINAKTTFLLILLLPGLFSTPFSIYYQVRLKSFCRLCFLVLSVLWLQATNLVAFFTFNEAVLDKLYLPLNFILVTLMSFSLASLWLILKPKYVESQKIKHQDIMLRKWRQNPYWFDALLPLHKKVDDSVWEREIFYGNPRGVLQFLVVSNPYCDYCAIAHDDLDKILDKHPNEVGIRIRLHVKKNDYQKQNDKFIAAFKITSVYENMVWRKPKNKGKMARSIISDWYSMDQDVWEKKYLSFDYNQNIAVCLKVIESSMKWCKLVGVKQTPSFFINGYEMPNPHTFKDLILFVSDYIQLLKLKKEKSAVDYSGF